MFMTIDNGISLLMTQYFQETKVVSVKVIPSNRFRAVAITPSRFYTGQYNTGTRLWSFSPSGTVVDPDAINLQDLASSSDGTRLAVVDSGGLIVRRSASQLPDDPPCCCPK